MNPQLPQLPAIPHEVIDAAKAVGATATKWGNVADSILSWNMPVAFALGAIACFVVVKMMHRTNP